MYLDRLRCHLEFLLVTKTVYIYDIIIFFPKTCALHVIFYFGIFNIALSRIKTY